tara:strand:- start:416 stop:649 length:234 start_codon:yes stop_codon:yes gene_type:complete
VNTEKLKKGLFKIGIFILLCFISPIIVYQAFKNQDHHFFYIVLVIGIGLCITTIFYGFWAIKILIIGMLGEKKTKSS